MRLPVMRLEHLVRLAIAGVIGAASWFAVGDLSSDVDASLDHLWKAGPAVSPVIAVVGVLSLAVLVGPGRAVWLGWSRSTRVRVVVLAAIVGIGTALTGRVVTAGTIGANIGGFFSVVLWILVVPGATLGLLIARGPHRRPAIAQAG